MFSLKKRKASTKLQRFLGHKNKQTNKQKTFLKRPKSYL